jgi:hypothetical protein
MVRQSLIVALVSALGIPANAGTAISQAPLSASTAATIQAPWAVAGSLKTTLRNWAQRAGWPAPQFLTDADWPVDVPGSIPGSIEEALKLLAQGFGRAAGRPRIELTVNHVIVVTEIGAE